MDVCAKLRGILQERRIGHGGTLDPMATGVLPVFVGQATRAVEFAENGEKEYRPAVSEGQQGGSYSFYASCCLAISVRAVKAALSLTAISASILRLISTPAFFMPFIKVE